MTNLKRKQITSIAAGVLFILPVGAIAESHIAAPAEEPTVSTATCANDAWFQRQLELTDGDTNPQVDTKRCEGEADKSK